jgi:hypothetical protein
MNDPIYSISGKMRKKEKMRLSHLKSYVKHFWHCEDVFSVMGGGLSDNEAKTSLEKAKKEVEILEKQLAVRL